RGKSRAVDVAACPADSIELAVGPGDLSLCDSVAGNTFHLHAFEDIEVDLLMVGLGRNRARAFRVPHDDIGVGTNADGAFARIDVEDLRGVGGRDADELIHGEPAVFTPAVHSTARRSSMPAQPLGIFVKSERPIAF